MGELFKAIAHAIREREPVAVVTEVQGPNPGAKMLVGEETVSGSLGDEKLDSAVIENARGFLDMAQTGTRTYGPQGQGNSEEVEVFIQAFSQPPDMYVLGAVNLANAVVRLGKFLGYRVTVVDARKIFANQERFPEADEVVVDWPDRYLAKVGADLGSRDAVCVLTHDHKFDVPAIRAALDTKVGYLGAMGSRRTNADRIARLREAGVDESSLSRVNAPVGLDIGARTPEETAISICGEIISRRTGRPAPSLRAGEGPIHS